MDEIKKRFTNVLTLCPGVRKVRNFIRDWLELIAAEKEQDDYSQLGF